MRLCVGRIVWVGIIRSCDFARKYIYIMTSSAYSAGLLFWEFNYILFFRSPRATVISHLRGEATNRELIRSIDYPRLEQRRHRFSQIISPHSCATRKVAAAACPPFGFPEKSRVCGVYSVCIDRYASGLSRGICAVAIYR